MNVIILTKTFPETKDDWKGIFVKEQAEAVAEEHSVTVVKCSVDNQMFRPFFTSHVTQTSFTGFKFFNIVVYRSFPVYNQFNYIIGSYLALIKIVKNQKPDIIHCHYSYPSGVIAYLVKLKTGIPYVVTEHSRIKSTFRSCFHRYLSLVALRKSNNVITVSNSLKKELLFENILNTGVIPNVIDAERFLLPVRSAEPFTLGFLGSLDSHNKGLGILLEACQGLPFDFRLKIGGSGVNIDFYKEMASRGRLGDKVIFIGNIEREKINDFYSDINLFILASRYETFGIVLVEALASGIPVIATRCGGPEDIVDDSNGILVSVDDPLQLREAIKKMYEEYNKYDPYYLHSCVTDKFGRSAFLEKINTVYKSAIRDREIKRGRAS